MQGLTLREPENNSRARQATNEGTTPAATVATEDDSIGRKRDLEPGLPTTFARQGAIARLADAAMANPAAFTQLVCVVIFAVSALAALIGWIIPRSGSFDTPLLVLAIAAILLLALAVKERRASAFLGILLIGATFVTNENFDRIARMLQRGFLWVEPLPTVPPSSFDVRELTRLAEKAHERGYLDTLNMLVTQAPAGQGSPADFGTDDENALLYLKGIGLVYFPEDDYGSTRVTVQGQRVHSLAEALGFLKSDSENQHQ